MTSQLSEQAVKEIILTVYDENFKGVDPNLRQVLIDNLDTGSLSSEITTYTKGMFYTNWNYHLLKGYESQITGIAATNTDEEEGLAIASLALRNFRLLPKIYDIVLAEQKKNTLQELLDYHTTRKDDLSISGTSRTESADIVAKINIQDVTDIDELVADHRSTILKAKDAIGDKILDQHNYTPAQWDVEVTKLNAELADINKGLNISENFTKYSSNLKASASSGAHNAFSLAHQTASAIQGALSGGDQPLESYFATSGYLAEATLGIAGDGATAFKHAKVGDGLKGAASVALVAASSASFASVAKMLDDPNLSAEHRRLIEAEVGLQGTALALGVVEGGLSIAQSAVQAGSKAASVLGKAVPIIGALGAVVGAINPSKWAEFDQKQDRIDALRNADTFSSDMLGDLLGESLTIQKGFYGATTALNVASGVGSAALAATGVGAPIAAAVGIIGGAISAIVGAFEQVALEDLADEYYDKITTDENGNKRSVEEYFEGSFDQQQDKTKARYEDFFESLTANQNIDTVYALGSQKLTTTDLSLSAITKAADELGKTAKHYFETYAAEGGWTKSTISVEETIGDDHINLPNANGSKSYLTFTSPLFASGNEVLSRESTGKNSYATTLKITDLGGWVVNDYGNNETTFDVDKVVTNAEGKEGHSREIDFKINAKGGNDTLFAYEAGITFDGGDGVDTASYSRLNSTEISEGLTITSMGTNYIRVEKHLNTGSKLYKESIETHTENYGKRTETVQYRAVSLVDNTSAITTRDHLSNIEIIHGSVRGDFIDVSGSSQITQIFGFGGNDQIIAGDSVRIVAAGSGNDEITVSDASIKRALKAKTNDDLIYIDGGEGNDLLTLSKDSYAYIEDAYETYTERQKLSREIAEKLTVAGVKDRETEVDKLTESLGKVLENAAGDGINALSLANVEQVFLTLTDNQAGESILTKRTYDLNHNANVLKFLGAESVAANGEKSLPGVGVSAVDVQGSTNLLGTESDNRMIGSHFDDLLLGNGGDDYLQGGNGNDLLIGGQGKDTYVVNANDFGHDLIVDGGRGEDGKFDSIIINANQNTSPTFYRNNDDLIVAITDDNSVTVANYFDKLTGVTKSGNPNNNVNNDAYPNIFADVNGDGRADHINFGYYHVNVALGQEDGSFAQSKNAWGSYDFATYGGWYAGSQRTAADVNGDGRADLIGFTTDGIRVALGQEDGTFVTVSNTAWGGANNSVEKDKYPSVFADVNGDGRADHVNFGYYHVRVALGQEDGSFGQMKNAWNSYDFATYGGWYAGSHRTAADVNGDGLADLIGFTKDGIRVALNDGNGSFKHLSHTSKAAADNNAKNAAHPKVFADVNGDGMADYVNYASDGVYVQHGQLNGSFGTAIKLTNDFTDIQHSTVYNWESGSYRTAADVDGDGRADLVGLGSNAKKVYLSINDDTVRSADTDTRLNSIIIRRPDGSTELKIPEYIDAVASGNYLPASGNSFADNYRAFKESGLGWSDLQVTDGSVPTSTRTTHQGTDAADTLVGSSGKDKFIAGTGYDVLTGGGGADVFIFDRLDNVSAVWQRDTITDFGLDDKIVFVGYDNKSFSDVNVTSLSQELLNNGLGNKNSVQINFLNKKRIGFQSTTDTINKRIELTSFRDSTENYTWNYERKDSILNIKTIFKGDTLQIKTKHLTKDDFLLTNRGFHWISERPFNR